MTVRDTGVSSFASREGSSLLRLFRRRPQVSQNGGDYHIQRHPCCCIHGRMVEEWLHNLSDRSLSFTVTESFPVAQGRFAEAERLHYRALTIREKVFGPRHPDVAKSLNNLGAVLENQVTRLLLIVSTLTRSVCHRTDISNITHLSRSSSGVLFRLYSKPGVDCSQGFIPCP